MLSCSSAFSTPAHVPRLCCSTARSRPRADQLHQLWTSSCLHCQAASCQPATNALPPSPAAARHRVPIEIRVAGDKEPVYDFSLEDLGRYNEQPVLPFNAYGTLAVARAEFENNSGSSQVGAACAGVV